MSERVEADLFSATDPREVGYNTAKGLLYVGIDLAVENGSDEAARRDTGIV